MCLQLTVDDLTTTTRYKTSIEGHLRQLLEVVHSEFDLPNLVGQWTKGEISNNLFYRSPIFNSNMNARAEFAFDIEREDANWSVSQIGLPSAYFAIARAEMGEELTNQLQDQLQYLNWSPAPENWGHYYLKAKQLDSLEITGSPLHLTYLNFFRSAREELWQALEL